MDKVYVALFGFGILEQGIVIKEIKDPEIFLENGEQLKLPIYNLMTSRDQMHSFIDAFFDNLENS